MRPQSRISRVPFSFHQIPTALLAGLNRISLIRIIRTAILIAISENQDRGSLARKAFLTFRARPDEIRSENHVKSARECAARKQLVFKRGNLRVDHAVEIQLAAAGEREVFCCVRKGFGMRGVFEGCEQDQESG